MPNSTTFAPLPARATRIAASLGERGQTVGVIEGSAGGLGSAALVAIPGASGPSGSRYGDLPGHVALAVVGPNSMTRTIETGRADRAVNMDLYARKQRTLFDQALH